MTKHNFRINGRFAKKPVNQVNELNQLNQLENHFCLVVDSSGSMQGLEKIVIKFVNAWLDDIRTLSRQYNQKTKVSLITYSYHPVAVFLNVDPNEVQFEKYSPYGMTALFEAQEKAINILESVGKKDTLNNQSFIVNHITDGYENLSYGGANECGGLQLYKERINNVVKLMNEKQQLGNWTFSFLVPPGSKREFCSYGIPVNNIKEWDNTVEGLYEAQQSTSDGLYAYYESRSLGGSCVNDFYG